jgi:hypothetical protein
MATREECLQEAADVFAIAAIRVARDLLAAGDMSYAKQ